MNLYTYDINGWFVGPTDDKQHQRATTVEPPIPVGDMQPNWTGQTWELQDYAAWGELQKQHSVPSAAQIRVDVLTELTEMEREALMPRVTREFMITATLMQAAQLGISQTSLLDPIDPAFSPGFKKMWDFNQKTIALRAKL